MIIGPSIGWLFAKGIYSKQENNRLLFNTGANAMELPLSTLDENGSKTLNDNENEKRISSIGYRWTDDIPYSMYNSLHLPNCEKSQNLEEQVELANRFLSDYRFSTVLIHPVGISVPYFENIEKSLNSKIIRTTFAIENMDKNANQGIKIEELEKLLQTYPNFGLVLDVQHAYEHDKEMNYASELFDMAKKKVKHFHVSGNGETGKGSHELLHKSQNRENIIRFLKDILSYKEVPIILEGQYENNKELKREIDFLKKELN